MRRYVIPLLSIGIFVGLAVLFTLIDELLIHFVIEKNQGVADAVFFDAATKLAFLVHAVFGIIGGVLIARFYQAQQDKKLALKAALAEIKRINDELELTVAERTKDLRQANQELEAFVYTVSHDLKSPLRAIDSYSKFILEDHAARMPEDANHMLGNIRLVCRDMFSLINKLIEYSTAASRKIKAEPVDLNSLFEAVFKELKIAHPGQNIELEFTYNKQPIVDADVVLLRQVIYNILSNCFKFTRNKILGIIQISCEQKAGEQLFAVKDNGAGFDMRFVNKLYGVFQRLHDADEFEGSGIGLATVKKIIEMHGGQTWIEGAEGQGATVYFTLPITK